MQTQKLFAMKYYFHLIQFSSGLSFVDFFSLNLFFFSGSPWQKHLLIMKVFFGGCSLSFTQKHCKFSVSLRIIEGCSRVNEAWLYSCLNVCTSVLCCCTCCTVLNYKTFYLWLLLLCMTIECSLQ